MGMHNDNVIRKVAAARFFTQKQRNVIACLAIMLTTFMVYAIFSIGMSFGDSMEKQEAQSAGVDADFILADFTGLQEAVLKDSGLCSIVGFCWQVACFNRTQDEKLGIHAAKLKYADEVCLKEQIGPAFAGMEGSFPQEEDEILVPRWLAEKLSIGSGPPGQEAVLDIYYGGTSTEYNRLSEDLEARFRISGIYDDMSAGYVRNMAEIYVSKSFWEAAPYEDGQYRKSAYITLSKGVGRQELLDALQLGEQQELTALKSSSREGGGGAMEVSVAAAVVMACGALIIYNVFGISAAQDVQFLGKMKTLGTTKRQLKKYLRYQIFWLCLAGIPAGLVLAVPASMLAVPLAVSAMNSKISQVSVSFSPLLFAGSVLVTALTVALGSLKPLRMAGSVQPVAAMRYVSVGTRKKERKKERDGMASIAWRNVFRSRKNAVSVFLSLFLAVMLLFTLDGLLSGFSAAAFVGNSMYYDIVVNGGQDLISEEAIGQIGALEGVASAESLCYRRPADSDTDGHDWLEVHDRLLGAYCKKAGDILSQIDPEAVRNAVKGDRYATFMIGIGQMEFERLRKACGLGLSYGEFQAGEAGIWLTDEKMYGEMPVGPQTVHMGGPDGKEAVIPKMESHTVDSSTLLLTSEVAPLILISNEMLSGIVDTDTCAFQVNIQTEDPAQDAQIQVAIKEILGNAQEISVDSKQEKIEQKDGSFSTIRVLGTAMSLILFAIGIMNFINTIYASILARDRELAMMECIGMSKRQVKQMLVMEGMFYMLVTAALVLTLGTVAYLQAYHAFTKLADWAQFRYPFRMAGITGAIMLLMSVLVPLISYHSISLDSAVAQLRKAAM